MMRVLQVMRLPRVFILFLLFFFFNDTATTEIYTLSLHDALPISFRCRACNIPSAASNSTPGCWSARSEEHTSELQSQSNLVCRLLLEKNKSSSTFKEAFIGVIVVETAAWVSFKALA